MLVKQLYIGEQIKQLKKNTKTAFILKFNFWRGSDYPQFYLDNIKTTVNLHSLTGIHSEEKQHMNTLLLR